jgi:hypothetical protein
MCAAPDPNDSDADGIGNAADNCPMNANPGQEDMDMDAQGDLCDACPTQANPGMAGCTVRIPQIRNPNEPGHVSEGSNVTIVGAVVTGLKNVPSTSTSQGFFVEDPSLTEWGGIFVFTRMAPTVQVGNVVTVTGQYVEFNGLAEITMPVVTVTDPGTTLPAALPRVVDPASINTAATAESRESMLVRINDVTVTNPNPDAPMSFDEFMVTGMLRIDDFLLDGANNMLPAFAMDTHFTSITGIVNIFQMQAKLEPRTMADLVTP